MCQKKTFGFRQAPHLPFLPRIPKMLVPKKCPSSLTSQVLSTSSFVGQYILLNTVRNEYLQGPFILVTILAYFWQSLEENETGCLQDSCKELAHEEKCQPFREEDTPSPLRDDMNYIEF